MGLFTASLLSCVRDRRVRVDYLAATRASIAGRVTPHQHRATSSFPDPPRARVTPRGGVLHSFLTHAALISQPFAGTTPRYHAERRYLTKDGRIIWGQLTATVIRDKQGHITFRIATVEDITSRKIAEHKLRRTAERLRALSRRVVDLQE